MHGKGKCTGGKYNGAIGVYNRSIIDPRKYGFIKIHKIDILLKYYSIITNDDI